MKCDCGHAEDHHNPAVDYRGMQDDFSGNCRNCHCTAFRVSALMNRPGAVHGLIARRRGEYIVRRWTDEVTELRVLLRRLYKHTQKTRKSSAVIDREAWESLKEEVEIELLKI